MFFVMIRIISVYLSVVIFLGSCNNNTQTPKDEIQPQLENIYIGKWNSTMVAIPFDAELEIIDNGVFKYSYKACFNRGFAIGRWEVDSPYLILNTKTIDSCLYIEEFGFKFERVDETGKITNTKPKTTKPGCKPTGNTFWVNFANDSFYISNDTLHHLQSNEYGCKFFKIAFVKSTDTLK